MTDQTSSGKVNPLVRRTLTWLTAAVLMTGLAGPVASGQESPSCDDPGVVCCRNRIPTITTPDEDGVFRGTEGNDVILATSGPDHIEAFGGRDIICAKGGSDEVFGGSGRDVIVGGRGDDVIDSGSGNDLVTAGTGDDDIRGDRGADRLFGGGGDDTINGGNGGDYIAGGNGKDVIRGAGGNDRIFGQGAEDRLLGGGGEDTIEGGADDDYIDGQSDKDVIRGQDGSDRLYGKSGDDIIEGGEHPDRIFGGGGVNLLDGGPSYDLCAGDGARIDCETRLHTWTVEEWTDLVAEYFDPLGETDNALLIMACESGGNPFALNTNGENPSYASGLFQFLETTWDWMAARAPATPLFDAGRYDPVSNVLNASKLVEWSIDNPSHNPNGAWHHWTCRRVLDDLPE